MSSSIEPSDENVQMLLSMGFPSESEVRRALKISKNDMNEAVDMLTNGQSLTYFDDQKSSPDANTLDQGSMDTSETQDFPAANLYELESRVYTDSWSIPYRDDESLAKCMYATMKLLDEGKATSDELCMKFLTQCLPSCFEKLLDAPAIYRWSADIQEGVYDMILLLMEVVSTALDLPSKAEQTFVPVEALKVLALSFNTSCAYHQKNRTMKSKVESWEDKMGADRVISQPIRSLGVKEHWWLSNLINKFHYHGGFEKITAIIELPKTNIRVMAALTEVLSSCIDFLSPNIARPLLEKSMKRVIQTVENLTADDFRDKNIGKACDLLRCVKVISQVLWRKKTENADELRLDLVLRMIKCPHFNAKMNALIEITKMIEDATADKDKSSSAKGAVPLEKLTQWMEDKELLGIILSGSIDQAQYCDKVKKIVEHVAPRLSREDLQKLWNRTDDQTSHVIDNIHGIFAAAASQFSIDQFSNFSLLITDNWLIETGDMKQKLISLLGVIGKDTKSSELAIKVVEVLWDLCHREDMSRVLVDRGLDEMYNIMTESSSMKDSYKKKYLERCIDSIKKGTWIMPSLKQLLNLIRNVVKQTNRADRARILSDIHKICDITKLLTSSLISCHQLNVKAATATGMELHPAFSADSKYTHEEMVELHLQCLSFVLQESAVFMSWNRVKDFWECMIVKHEACPWDRDVCYRWLTEQISELETEAVGNLFAKKLLADHSHNLSSEGFKCWKKFFEAVNLHEHKLKAGTLLVEKTDLVGLNELWTLCLNIGDSDIAKQAISFLLDNIYINLAPKYKRDTALLHKKFIAECHGRLETLLISLRAGGSVVFRSLSQALHILSAPIVPGLEKLPAPLTPTYVLNIERLLLIVENYVLAVEEAYNQPRSILPHGSSFYGSPLTIHCECETRKENFVIQTHRNESLLSFRTLIADHMGVSPQHIQFSKAELKSHNKDQRLLGQLGVDDGHKILFRLSYLPSTTSVSQPALPTVSESVPTATASASASAVLGATSPIKLGNWEYEKNLPGVMIAHESQVFKLLYQLAELGEHQITRRVVALLHLIPTDPAVVDMIDNITCSSSSTKAHHTRSMSACTNESLPSSAASSPATSPAPSPRKVRNATGSAYGSQTSMLSRKSSSSTVIGALFNRPSASTTNKETSPFRVRYNLEVLSSRIMPVDLPSGRPTQFCEEFISGNGLSLMLQIFHVEYFPADVEHEVRQACYSLALQIISYLLCGETVRGTAKSILCSLPLPSLQSMELSEFSDMISCLMRVSWAASVGKHHLSSSIQPTKDLTSYGRLRQNSADSAASSSSDSDLACLHAGVCLSQTAVDPLDSAIAVKAFDIMIFCLCSRQDLIGCFYSLPCVSDFLLDVLTCCCRHEVRECVSSGLKKFSECLVDTSSTVSPKHFLLRIVLSARLPYWVTYCSTRGAKQRLLNQCLQYFDLRCYLLMHLTLEEQQSLDINVSNMLKDEINWLCNFQPSASRTSDLSTDDILLTGHLKLVQCLLTCEGVDKTKLMSLIHTLLDEFLFPTSKLERSSDCRDSLTDYSPKCVVSLTQSAAYDVLIEVCKDSMEGLQTLASKLVLWHHSTTETTDWEYMPPVEGRAPSGFVGLKNGGATCYMNSVIQQMFMIPGIADAILGVDEDELGDVKTVFHEMQHVFGHLLYSQLQYYEPAELWHVFKLWGQSVNVREQQDSFDFFTALTDQLDESLKKFGKSPIFQNKLQGVFSDQKNCDDCLHKYEREEPFLALNLTVSNPSLEQSLDQFVKGDLLEGDNAYFCEKCNLKRNAVKKMCIKTLPSVLCIHLKRFSFDWEANKALKFDDYFKFPLVLDMGPYTAAGGSARYELVGVVVHTGQASAGHYYSFIKDRRGSAMSNTSFGKWFKFNDTTVEEFEMTDEALSTECFGGKYKVKNTNGTGNVRLPEDRIRYWNAYLLFYERISTPKIAGNRRSSRFQKIRMSSDSSARKDSLSELSDLVNKGEQQGIFSSKISGRVQQSVRVSNLQFLRNRIVYSPQYFTFVRDVVSIPSDDVNSMKLQVETALKFILNTYLRTKEVLRKDMQDWYTWFKMSFQKCPEALEWFINYITDDVHAYIVPFLLTCCIKDIRDFFLRLLRCATEEYMYYLQQHHQPLTGLDSLLEALLSLLNREVIEHSKNSHEYFLFFYRYSKMSDLAVDHLITQGVTFQFANFLIGKLGEDSTLDNLPRRFSPLQSREFGPLQCTLAVLLLHVDFLSPSNNELLQNSDFPHIKLHPNPLIGINEEIKHVLSPFYSDFLIREALIALKEMDSSTVLVVVDALVYVAYNLPHFSDSLIHQIRYQIDTSPGNELRGITKLTVQLLVLPDQSQNVRLEELVDEPNSGILKIIQDSQISDSQKSYQLIKLLTSASNKSNVVAQYLLGCSSKWQWCVNWLKKKMQEQSLLSHAATSSNEDSLSKNFQRTTSAQITLDHATAMFNSSQGSSSDMDVDSSHSDDVQTVPNVDQTVENQPTLDQ